MALDNSSLELISAQAFARVVTYVLSVEAFATRTNCTWSLDCPLQSSLIAWFTVVQRTKRRCTSLVSLSPWFFGIQRSPWSPDWLLKKDVDCLIPVSNISMGGNKWLSLPCLDPFSLLWYWKWSQLSYRIESWEQLRLLYMQMSSLVPRPSIQ